MTMQSSTLPACNMEVFGNDIRHFWMDTISGLLEKYPNLEFPHKQDFYTLLFIENAEGEVIIDDKKFRIDQPKIIIIKPRCMAGININRKAEGKIVCFTENFFSLRYNNNVLYQFSFLGRNAIPFVRLAEDQKDQWKSLLSLISKEYSNEKRDKNKVLRSYTNILLFELDRLYNAHDAIHVRNLKHEKVQQFEILINDHYIAHKLPSFYAEQLCVTPNYLNKLCKEETGVTAGELIRKRVMIEAQRMLYYTFDTVNEIAVKLGFETASYFITFFKKNSGQTPEQFRKHQN